MKRLSFILVFFFLPIAVAAQGVPFDSCGTIQFAGGGCDLFKTLCGGIFETWGDLGGFHPGDTVRIVGTYEMSFSFCMMGNCCVSIQSISKYNPTNIKDKTEIDRPVQFELGQNHPNPFNPVTVIEYSVAFRTQVTIEVFSVLGQKVRILVDEAKAAGSYQVEWDGNDNDGKSVSSGVYFYRFKAGDFAQTKKMLLMK